jgi:hypothetical protein
MESRGGRAEHRGETPAPTNSPNGTGRSFVSIQ